MLVDGHRLFRGVVKSWTHEQMEPATLEPIVIDNDDTIVVDACDSETACRSEHQTKSALRCRRTACSIENRKLSPGLNEHREGRDTDWSWNFGHERLCRRGGPLLDISGGNKKGWQRQPLEEESVSVWRDEDARIFVVFQLVD